MKAESAAADAEAPAKTKKKRKRQKPPSDEAKADVASFARSFPKNEELTALLAKFEAGNYAAVRDGTASLLKKSDDEAVKRAARELRARISPDPIAVYLLLAAMALLAFLSIWYWTHGHTPL